MPVYVILSVLFLRYVTKYQKAINAFDSYNLLQLSFCPRYY